ncbi:MAG: ABC transporter substrate-binding protein [Methylibium sp.]|uniref:MlaC/ttg2D family ABC transporter substrate-binding protein n=1 Tax=Methylibium sp. TaxID=2067992 RepID=UPI0018487D2C|nr:ABC transporter substrate-binding protein [Methylibium sp.]MBA3597557.1 ABC transporter substrate-binding protein [Methylibium sp.]
MLKRQFLARLVALGVSAFVSVHAPAQAQTQTPDALVKQVSGEVIDTVKADKSLQTGDVSKIMALVDAKVMPHVNFERMTAAAVGRYWRQATPEQQQKLMAEFKTLLVRTYSGALREVKDQVVEVRPMRSRPEDTEVIVRTEVKGSGQPIQLDYRLEKRAQGWKIYDVNVLGIWLVENYRNSFAREISAGGIDGLIAKMTERNKSAASKS